LLFPRTSAGAGGCVLAQTLLDGGLYVLLIERGDERNEVLKDIRTQDLAFLDECVEKFSSDGVILGTGNCMGGKVSGNDRSALLCVRTNQFHAYEYLFQERVLGTSECGSKKRLTLFKNFLIHGKISIRTMKSKLLTIG